jgi:hypothetical protein
VVDLDKKDVLAVVNILVMIILGIGGLMINQTVIDLQNRIFDLESASRRVDIRILVDNLIHEKNNDSSSVNTTIVGYICNEGSRKTIIEGIEIWVFYRDEFQFRYMELNRSRGWRILESEDVILDFHWNNACLAEDEARPFLVNFLFEPMYFWKEELMLYNYSVNLKQSQDHSWRAVQNFNFSGFYLIQLQWIETIIRFNDGIDKDENTYTIPIP